MILFTLVGFIFFSNKNNSTSNTTWVNNMIENKECIKNVDSIFDDVKFVSNSSVRFRILATLFKRPQNMKELTESTKLSYSSVSSNMHVLELRKFIYRQHNRYYLTNSAKVRVGNLLEFHHVIKLINDFFNILEGHVVDMIPIESIMELNGLERANLMESSGVDAYRTYNFIDKCLSMADNVRCIIPFYYEPFFKSIEDLASEGKSVELFVPTNILENFDEDIKHEYISSFDEENVFLLIVTNQVMILGLFMENGYFDQNRLITSKNENSINWAEELFENFKKRYDK